jgi:hypothetical protein
MEELGGNIVIQMYINNMLGIGNIPNRHLPAVVTESTRFGSEA